MRMMKLTGLAFLALMGTTAVASAADVYGRPSYKDEPILASVASWAGFYVGGNVGGAFFDEDNNNGGGDSEDEILIGGVHVGFNRQSEEFVYGLEGDVNVGDDLDYLASIRGRLGFAHDSLLLYVTAGYAFAEDGDNDSADGFVGGGGLEKKLRENVSIGLEGLYYSLENDDDNDLVDNDDQVDFFTVRGRLTFHLNRHHEAIEPLK